MLRTLALLLAAHSRATPKQAKSQLYGFDYIIIKYETDYKKAFLLVLTSICCDTYAQQENDKYSSNRTEIIGVWRSIGDGYLLKLNDKEITLYSYTSKHCYTEQNDYVIDLLNNSSKFYLNRTKDTLSVYLHDFGNKTKTLQDEKRFYKLNSLPDNCKSLTEAQQNDPEYLFELFYSTLKENYAFAKERKIDWENIYKNYRQKLRPRSIRVTYSI